MGRYLVLGRDVIAEQGQGRIVFAVYARAKDANTEQRTSRNPLVVDAREGVHLARALVDIAEVDHAERRSGAHLALVLVLVQPRAIRVGHQTIGLEASVDKGVDKGAGKVLLGRVVCKVRCCTLIVQRE